MIYLAKRILPETKEAIIQEFQQGKANKALLARKYNISSSTVSRILASADIPPETSMPEPPMEPAEDFEVPEEPPQVHNDAITRLYEILEGTDQAEDMETLVNEFGKWIKSRDELEKEKVRAAMDLESLRAERASIENRIFALASKAANLELVIGRMKTSAENAQVSMSLVEERLSNIEERLSTNRDILMIAAGIKSLIDRGDIDDETLSFIQDYDDMWKPDSEEMRERIRKALVHYVEMANSKVRNLKI